MGGKIRFFCSDRDQVQIIPFKFLYRFNFIFQIVFRFRLFPLGFCSDRVQVQIISSDFFSIQFICLDRVPV